MKCGSDIIIVNSHGSTMGYTNEYTTLFLIPAASLNKNTVILLSMVILPLIIGKMLKMHVNITKASLPSKSKMAMSRYPNLS
jgi:uncharacterized protein (UPF0254 family)